MPEGTTNKTIVLTRPGTDEVTLVVAIIRDPHELDVERLLSGMVPEMARGGVRGGLLVIGDHTLVLRNQGHEIHVDEVDTTHLLTLADIDEHWTQETILQMMQQWIERLRHNWRDRIVGKLREYLVPHIVAGLAGDLEICDGVWGQEAHRVVEPSDP